MNSKTLHKLFEENVKYKKAGDRHCFDCKKGLFGVQSTNKADAQQNAKHYFMQYFLDGGYDG